MPKPFTGDSWSFLLHDTARLLRLRFEQRLRASGSGMTRAHWSVLTRLARHEGISQKALAELLEIKAATLMRLLDAMERAGMVERRADPQDRRAHRLHLAGGALAMLDELDAVAKATRGEAMRGVSPDAEQALAATLLQIKTNLHEAMAPDQAGTRRHASPATPRPTRKPQRAHRGRSA